MHPLLNEINEFYLPHEEYLEYDEEKLARLPLDEVNQFLREQQQRNVGEIIEEGGRRFVAIAAKLSVDDILEGFKKSGPTLKAHLTGYMTHHFDRAFISHPSINQWC